MSIEAGKTETVTHASRPLVGVGARIRAVLRPLALPFLRISLGVVFVWFGALKAAGVTPVGDLVAGAFPWLDRSWFVPALGVAEVVLGLALLVGRWLTFVGVVLIAHLCGTFLVLVMEPHLAFQYGNPLLLTTVGEFVLKNLVLISAAVVLAAQLRRPHSTTPPDDTEPEGGPA